MNVKILLLPDGDDPDSFARKHNATEFKSYVEEHQTDFIIFKTNLLLKDAGRDPLKRAQLTQSIVYSISVIPDEILRSAYVHECAELLQQDEAMLLREISKNKQAAIEQMRKQAAIEQERQQRLAERQNAEPHPQPDSSEPSESSEPPSPDSSSPVPHPLEPAEFPQSSSPDTSSPSPSPSSFFHGLERMIMTLIVRYGEQTIECEDAEGQPLSIPLITFVANDLQTDGIQLQTPLYAQMLTEAIQHIGHEGFVASRYFLNSPDLEISREAANLMTERYQLSKRMEMPSEQELMPDYIFHLLLDYKFAIINSEMKACQAEMSNPDRCQAAMTRYMELSGIQRQLAKQLGDRILIN